MLEAEDWVAMASLTFIGVLTYLGVHRKIIGVLDQRRERISAELDEARLLKDDALALLVAYQNKQEEAAREAEDIIARAMAETERLASEAKAKTDDFFARQTKLAETKIAQAEAQALADVRFAAADAAVAIAEKLVRQAIQKDTTSALVTRSIKALKVCNWSS
jgi:F-type H+-transporting ATPase subunit b